MPAQTAAARATAVRRVPHPLIEPDELLLARTEAAAAAAAVAVRRGRPRKSERVRAKRASPAVLSTPTKVAAAPSVTAAAVAAEVEARTQPQLVPEGVKGEADARTRLELVLKFVADQIEKEREHQLQEQSRRQNFLLELSSSCLCPAPLEEKGTHEPA